MIENARIVDAPDGVPVPVPAVADCGTLVPPGESRTPAYASSRSGDDVVADLTLSCHTTRGDVRLPALLGRPTVVNLWASWCAPCRKEMPALQAAAMRYDRQVRFLGVDTKDSPEAAAAFLRELWVTYPQAVDPEGLLLGDLRFAGNPPARRGRRCGEAPRRPAHPGSDRRAARASAVNRRWTEHP